jgi:hypothetical protein
MKKFSTPDSLFPRARVLLLAFLLVLVTGCSTIRFTYNNGDTLLYWWLNAYLELANWQRQLAGNPTQADLLGAYRDVKARTELLAFKALPEMADLARSVKPEQIVQMEKKFKSNNDDYRKKFMSGDLEKQRRAHFKKSMDQFELWFGHFSSDQEAQLRRASDARPLDNEVWLQERMLRQQKIIALLRRVQQQKLNKEQTMAAIHTLMRDFFDRMDAPERKAFFDAYVDNTSKFILTAIKITTPAQKAHAQKRMQGWIDDFNTLARGG